MTEPGARSDTSAIRSLSERLSRVRTGTFTSLQNRDYRRFAIGCFISNIGTWAQRLAQDWLVLAISNNDGRLLGLVTGLQFLPILVLSPLAGAIADRLPKRMIVMAAQILMALCATAMAILAVTGIASPWHVLLIVGVYGSASAFDTPARHSLVSDLVALEQIANAVSINGASFNSARVIGPALAGFAIALLGAGEFAAGCVLLAAAATNFAVVLALRGVAVTNSGRKPDRTIGAPSESRDRDPGVRAGMRYVAARRDMGAILILVFFAGAMAMNLQLTLALVATQTFEQGAGQLGILNSALAAGCVAGAIASASRGNPAPPRVVRAAVMFGGCLGLAALAPTFPVLCVWLPVVGVAMLMMLMSANSSAQIGSSSVYRGRVMALYVMLLQGSSAFAAPFLGWIGEEAGARWNFVVGAALVLIGAALASWRLHSCGPADGDSPVPTASPLDLAGEDPPT